MSASFIDRLEIALATVEVDERPSSQRLCHGVDREVPPGEVVIESARSERADVDLPSTLPRDHPPTAELLRKRKSGRADMVGDRSGGLFYVTRGDQVDI